MIIYLHIPKCAGSSTLQHFFNTSQSYSEIYTKRVPQTICSSVNTGGNFERIKGWLGDPNTYLGNPDYLVGIGIYKGIENYFPSADSVEYHTRLFDPVDRAISMYKFRRGRYLGAVPSPTIYKEGGQLVNFSAMMTAEFEKEDGTERTFAEWFEYFNSRTIDEYDMTSYENTLSVRGLTTDDFAWIGNENNLGNLPTVNVSPSYDTPERSVVEELVNTHWPNDMAIYSASFAYNDTTPDYLL